MFKTYKTEVIALQWPQKAEERDALFPEIKTQLAEIDVIAKQNDVNLIVFGDEGKISVTPGEFLLIRTADRVYATMSESNFAQVYTVI